MNIISSLANSIKDFRRAILLLVSITKLEIQNALYSAKSKRNPLSFKNIRRNRYHNETLSENKAYYLYIIKNVLGKKLY